MTDSSLAPTDSNRVAEPSEGATPPDGGRGVDWSGAEAGAVTILIARHVRPERLAEFEAVVKAWIPKAVKFPGHLGVYMLRPGVHTQEYGALLRFRSRSDWERFREWSPYLEFVRELRPLLLSDPRVETMHGLELWFGSIGGNPPRWKMALLTWMGVNGMVLITASAMGALGGGLPRWAAFLIGNAVVVAGLTWVVMPLLSKGARRWLVGAVR